jgi:hypothetical protein
MLMVDKLEIICHCGVCNAGSCSSATEMTPTAKTRWDINIQKGIFYNFETACTSRMPWKMRSLQLLCSLKVHLNKSSHHTAHFTHRINVGREGSGPSLYCRSFPRCGAQKPSVAVVLQLVELVHVPVPGSRSLAPVE